MHPALRDWSQRRLAPPEPRPDRARILRIRDEAFCALDALAQELAAPSCEPEDLETHLADLAAKLTAVARDTGVV